MAPLTIFMLVMQGCTMAPVLFNLYFATMVGCWRAHCPEAGVTVKYRMGRKLVGDRTVKARLEEVAITESKFADDAALFAVTMQTSSGESGWKLCGNM